MLNVIIVIFIFLMGGKSIYTLISRRPEKFALHLIIDIAFYCSLITTIALNNFDLINMTPTAETIIAAVLIISLPFKVWSFIKTKN